MITDCGDSEGVPATRAFLTSPRLSNTVCAGKRRTAGGVGRLTLAQDELDGALGHRSQRLVDLPDQEGITEEIPHQHDTFDLHCIREIPEQIGNIDRARHRTVVLVDREAPLVVGIELARPAALFVQVFVRHADYQKATGFDDADPVFQRLAHVAHVFEAMAGVDRIIGRIGYTSHHLRIPVGQIPDPHARHSLKHATILAQGIGIATKIDAIADKIPGLKRTVRISTPRGFALIIHERISWLGLTT